MDATEQNPRGAKWMSVVTISLLGIIASIYVIYFVSNQEKTSLIQRSATVAAAVSIQDVLALTGTPSDTMLPEYQRIKEKLIRIKGANPDIRFVYLTALQNGQVKFLVDSENPDSKDYSPPGQVYGEASGIFLSSFDTNSAFVEGPTQDRWGIWISALTPITNPTTDKNLSMVGIDVDAREYMTRLFLYSLLPILVTIGLMGIALTNFSLAERERNNMRVRSEFIAVASHELRSPLTGIKWMLQKIYDAGNNLTDEQKTQVYSVIQNCQKILFTVNDVLEIASLEKGKFALRETKPENLYSIMREAIESQQFNAGEKNITVVFSDGWRTIGDEVVADKNRLKMAFANVISNAIKYSREKSKVLVSLSQTDKEYKVSVADKGIGIPQGEQERIFKGFFRATNAKLSIASGTGLGLYYTKAIIDLHKGKISFDSKENEGSTFHITLPKA